MAGAPEPRDAARRVGARTDGAVVNIDRGEFLRLAMLLAACGNRGAAGPTSSDPITSGPIANAAPPETDVLAVDPSCSNARGVLAACSRVRPTCDGKRDECRSLG